MNVNETNPMKSHLGPTTRERALRDVNWVAEFLGVSKSWVYQAASSGVLPCIRIGAALRFSADDIKAWVKGESKARNVSLPGCR